MHCTGPQSGYLFVGHFVPTALQPLGGSIGLYTILLLVKPEHSNPFVFIVPRGN